MILPLLLIPAKKGGIEYSSIASIIEDRKKEPLEGMPGKYI
jgi:hypothetical protein